MKGIGILQHTIARPKIIAVIQVILKRIVWRVGRTRSQHLLRHRHVNVCPDAVRSRNIITKLRLVEHTILVGLIVASPQNPPAVIVHIANTLNDRIILHASTMRVNRHSLSIQRNHDVVSVRIARHRRLEDTRCAILRLRQHLQLRCHLRRHILTGHRLTGVDNVKSPRAPDIQLPLEHALLQHGIIRLAGTELHQKVNAVLVSRLPLVDRSPRISTSVSQRSHRRAPWRKDQSIGLILKLGVQHRVDGFLHRRSIASQEHLGLHTQGATAHLRCKVPVQIGYKLATTSNATSQRIRDHLAIRCEQREASRVLTTEGVDIKDTEQMQILHILTINCIANVVVLRCRQTGPCDRTIGANQQHLLVPHDHQETSLSVSLIRDRIASQDIVRAVCANVTALHGDRV